MSTPRLDVMSITERTDGQGNKKTYFQRCGVAFQTRDGTGWTVTLDSLPVSGKLLLSPPKERTQSRGGDDFPG